MNDTQKILEAFTVLQDLDFGAKFFKVDLHFHTPASEDARGKNRYGFNPYNRKYPRKADSATYTEKIEAIRSDIFKKSKKLADKMVSRFLAEDLSLVAITDHNGIGTLWNDIESKKSFMDLAAPTWYEMIDDAAQRINTEKGGTAITILPGVEISTTGVHILAVFPPQHPRRKIHFIICDLLNEVGFDIEGWGKNPRVGTASVFDTINLILRHGGIPIPAHIDGSSQALLDLYPITGGAMKNVLRHRQLSAIEIVEPVTFTKKDKKLKKSLYRWIAALRQKDELTAFAYFQGSDAHDLKSIGKRLTYVKMTEPTFSGLETAIKMPASRVRISDVYQPVTKGLFVYGMTFENAYYGKRALRLNRHLNCITGKKGTGKSGICDLMQAAAYPDISFGSGNITLIMERIENGAHRYFAFQRSDNQVNADCFEIETNGSSAKILSAENARKLRLIPKFYNTRKIEEIVQSEDKLNAFLIKHFGSSTEKNVAKFNQLFSIDNFLEEQKESLLSVKLQNGRYRLFMNVNWQTGKAKMTDILKLSHSMRKTAMMCIIIIMSEFGPAIIDAPETDFDNEDIIKFLVPIIKKYKDHQQIIIFTNNPLFAINTDPDNYILLNAKGTKLKDITSGFAIDDETHRPMLVDIMEGSLKSFRKRAVRYDL